MAEGKSIAAIMREMLVREAFPPREQAQVINLPSSCTTYEAMQTLAQARVLSAPVKEKGTAQWLGLVDMFDLLTELIKAFTEHHKAESGDVHMRWVSWVRDPKKISSRGVLLAEEPITQLMNQSRENPLRFVTDNAPLLELLLNFKEGIHRVIMKDNHANLLRIVSQSDMLRFIHQHIDTCGEWKNKQVKELKSVESPIISVNTNARALHAFLQMHLHGVSAVAVVDHQGILVGSISVSDLRSLDPTHLETLHLPVMEYLKQREADAPSAPIVCAPTATLAEAIDRLVAARVHRIWVVDEPWQRPIGLVSLTDIMGSFFMLVGGSMTTDRSSKI